MRVAVPGEHGQAGAELLPEVVQVGLLGPQLGQPRGGGTGGVADELHQDLGAEDLDGVGHGHAGRPEPAQRGELRGGPLAGDRLLAEVGALGHRAADPGLLVGPALQIAGVAVEHPVLAVAVALGGHQGAAPGARHRALQQEDVGLLAGLHDAELGVDRGEFGDHPVGARLWALLGGGGLVPGGPAVALGRPVPRRDGVVALVAVDVPGGVVAELEAPGLVAPGLVALGLVALVLGERLLIGVVVESTATRALAADTAEGLVVGKALAHD